MVADRIFGRRFRESGERHAHLVGDQPDRRPEGQPRPPRDFGRPCRRGAIHRSDRAAEGVVDDRSSERFVFRRQARAGDALRDGAGRLVCGRFGLRLTVLLAAAAWRAAEVFRQQRQALLKLLHRPGGGEPADDPAHDVQSGVCTSVGTHESLRVPANARPIPLAMTSSAFRIAAPAAPRMVLCPSATSL